MLTYLGDGVGMAHCMDSGIGNITAALHKTGRFNTTLIVFSAECDAPASSVSPPRRHCYRCCCDCRACSVWCAHVLTYWSNSHACTLLLFSLVSCSNGGREDGIFGGNNWPLRKAASTNLW
jgi:hypothetical protein